MRINYDGILVMPKNYAVMNPEEMTYIDGGSYNVPMTPELDSKNNCGGMAQWLFAGQFVTGMTLHEIAVELYAHAVCYYHPAEVSLLIGGPLALYCAAQAADGVALMDGGDSAVRKAFYNLVWELF